ncbi:putative ribonuclease H-like domain-containing protein, partial [Tanacetum coccineum]
NKFENASKSLDKLKGSQISDNSRKGVGYNAVPPPPTGLFAPLIIDFSYSGLEEFQQPEFKGYGPKSVYVDTSNEVKKNPDTPLVEELVSEKEKQTIFPKQQDKTDRKPVKYEEMYRSQKPRGNQRNWNNLKSQQLGSDFVMYNKACFVCGSFDHIQAHCKYHQRERMVNTAKVKVNTVRPKAVNNARPNSAVVNAVRDNQANAVKASACWGIPPTDNQGYVDSGCSRHMTSNISYLSDFQEFDGGYVTFGGGVKGGKITGKSTLKTGKLGFQDVFFVKELQFNLFSVSQMCDKKNCVLFTDTACFVLSPDFKLPDESQILFKIPRKNNMYIVDMKNIVPKESLTCLVAKATLDESMLWHRRLGHINFTTINKLVKDNLVRGLPSKRFENDQTYVAFLKGKQQKASCNRPKVAVDIDSLTKSMNYVQLLQVINLKICSSEVSMGEGTTSNETDISQDYNCDAFVEDSSLFDFSTMNPSINTASANLITGSLHINIVSPPVLTTRSNRPQSVSDIISLRDNVSPKAINADLLGDEIEINISNLNA